jgi:hypothetical protein
MSNPLSLDIEVLEASADPFASNASLLIRDVMEPGDMCRGHGIGW